MKSNFPVEILMAVVVIVINGPDFYQKYQDRQKLAAQEEALKVSKEIRDEKEKALNIVEQKTETEITPDVVDPAEETEMVKNTPSSIEEDVVEEVSEKVQIPPEELLQYGEFLIPLSYEGELSVEQKVVVRDTLQGFISGSSSSSATDIDTAHKLVLDRLKVVHPIVGKGVSTIEEETKLTRLQIDNDLSLKILDALRIAEGKMDALEAFWKKLRGFVVNEEGVFELPEFSEVAIVGHISNLYEEDEIILISDEPDHWKWDDPVVNGDIWPAHVVRGDPGKKLVQIFNPLEDQSYSKPHLLDLEELEWKFKSQSGKAVIIKVNGTPFIHRNGEWKIFIENELASKQVAKISNEDEKVWLIFPRKRTLDFKNFLEAEIPWPQLKDVLLADRSKFKEGVYGDIRHFVCTESFEKDLAKAYSMWIASTALLSSISQGVPIEKIDERFYNDEAISFKMKFEGAFIPDKRLNERDVREEILEIRNLGKGFKLDGLDFLSPETIPIRGLERSSVGDPSYPVARITWRRKQLVPGKSTKGGCNIVFIDKQWSVVLPVDKYYDQKAELAREKVAKVEKPKLDQEKPAKPKKELNLKGKKTWTSASGKKITAEFVRFDGEDKIMLKSKGRLFSLRIDRLSKADQKLLGR